MNDPGLANANIEEPPFKFTEDIAELSSHPDFGQGLLIPVPHSVLVKPAEYKGKPLSFMVPPNHKLLESSFYIPADVGPNGEVGTGPRHAPEFVHVRHQLNDDGTIRDLNESTNVISEIKNGGYNALHYLDFTSDGWIDISCAELATVFPRHPIPAYS